MPAPFRRRAVWGAALLAAGLGAAACGGAPSTRTAAGPHHVPGTTAPTVPLTTPTTPPATPTTPAPTTAPTTAPVTTPPALAAPAVPVGHAYLGAWVNPEGQHQGGGSQEMAQLSTFQAAVGRNVSILHIYAGFHQPAPVPQLDGITANGSLPMLDWGCAPPAQVVSGQDDALIAAYAQALKHFGHPVLLRWFWEMNLRATARRCQLTDPATFVAAWQHVWTIFHQQGATNVAFVWCPGISAGLASMAPLYPGDAYVDWIGVDGYDRGQPGATAFSTIFGAWYAEWAGHGRPLMIGETGAPPAQQAAYLGAVAQELPSQYPDIRAFVYFNAPGPAGQWQLSGPGLTAFAQLASDPYFSAQP